MNVLILTGKFGMGHYSAARAIKEQIIEENPEVNVEIIDLIDYAYPKIKNIIYGVFDFLVTRLPSLYNYFNKKAEKHSEVPLKNFVSRKLDKLFREYRPQLIINTFPGCGIYSSHYISIYNPSIRKTLKSYTYITDITVHEGWISDNTDLYFVGSEKTRHELINMGIDEECIRVSGIPVRNIFKNQIEEPAKRLHQKEVLVMGGGLGLLPGVKDVLDALNKEEGIHITVITGKNKKLAKKLKRKYKEAEIVGFTDRVDYYMRRADLIVTKSGGITTFEAIYSATPLYIITPFLMQEIGNAHFVEDGRMGKVAWEKQGDWTADILKLLKDDFKLSDMGYNMIMNRKSFKKASPIEVFRRRGGINE